MKNRCLRFIACICIMITLLAETICVHANNSDDVTVLQVEELIDEIISYKLEETGSDNVQMWINGSLAKNAGVASEWYILALRQTGSYDFSEYEKALSDYLKKNRVSSASSRQKYALVLKALGSRDEYIQMTLNDSIGKQGIMSYVYGLHLLNNELVSSQYSTEDVINQIISMQLMDGGFAIMGEISDVDVTSMTLQALAPYYTNENVKNVVDEGIDFLASRQQEDGMYASYGVSNCESTAQVLVALSSLGIDALNDERFIKNGNTLLEGILKCRNTDGSFSHTEGGDGNDISTVQVLHSLISYVRMKAGNSPIYILDTDSVKETETEAEDTTVPKEEKSEDGKSGMGYKLPVSIVIAALAVMFCIIQWCRGKRNRNNLLIIVLMAIGAIIVVQITDLKTKEEYYENISSEKQNVIGEITIEIRCDTIATGEDSVILAPFTVEIEEGNTVFDVLLEATASNKIHVESSGDKKSVYVQGIDYIYEFEHGDLSGWVYCVNGEQMSVSSGEYVLKDGDVVEWLYTCEMGKDLKK